MAKKNNHTTTEVKEAQEAVEEAKEELKEATTKKEKEEAKEALEEAKEELKEVKAEAKKAPEVNPMDDLSIPYSDLGYTVSQLVGMEPHKRQASLGPRLQEFEKKYMS